METGKTLKPWTKEEALLWKKEQTVKRSYDQEIVSKINLLNDKFDVTEYGTLNCETNKYKLYLIESKKVNPDLPYILITGGVHGYETSGAHGALKFLDEASYEYSDRFNFVCAPCVSPWGYETINRWNIDAIDPNRSFYENSPALECKFLYEKLKNMNTDFLAHFDLHETTDTDNTVFRPALEKRDGIHQEVWDIPDGFYLVADSSREENDFQKAIIKEVKKVTHIAPSDNEGKIIGVKINHEGVINYDVKKLHLCASLTNAPYVTTTEVYPDSPKVTDQECNDAQVAAVVGGLKYLSQL